MSTPPSFLAHDESIEDKESPGSNFTSQDNEWEQDTSEDDDYTFESKTDRIQREALSNFLAGEFNLKSERDVVLFEEKYKKCLTGGRNGDTLVHLILREYNPTTFHLLLEVCLRLMPTILEERNLRGETPLHLAIERRVGCHLNWLVSKTPRPAQAIACTGPNNGNCLHTAIRHKESQVRYLIEMCNASSIMAQDEDGCTPLHYAVDAKCYTSQQLEVVKDLLNKCPEAAIVMNKMSLSAYKVSKRSWAKYDQDLEATRNAEQPEESRQSASEIKLMRSKKNIERRAKQIRLGLTQQVQHYLQTFILRQYDLDTWTKILYDEGKELELVFDLMEFEGSTPRNLLARLRNLKTFLHFDNIIAHVIIPKLGERENESQNQGDSRQYPVTKLQTDIAPKEAVIAVFDLLRKCGVTKIVQVTVEDCGNPPYDDDTIEAALSGFDVDNWDWRTQDICAETIIQVAPNAKTLKLYPSGNNGVLQSWSASDGLVQLSQLHEVTLVVGNIVQSRERALRNIERFCARLDNESQGKIRVAVKDARTRVALPTNSDMVRRHEFPETLSRIATNLGAFDKLKGSKIALVDDGVEATSEKVGERIAKGRSFAYLTDGRVAPWWTSSSGRGSTIAEVLCEFSNPVELYVARVGIDPKEPDAFIPSATQAIRWAVAQDVDIICFGSFPGMSWQASIETYWEFERALSELRKKDIVFMTIPAYPLESGVKSEVSYSTHDATEMLSFPGALSIAMNYSQERGADFLFPGQYRAPIVSSAVRSEADLNADSVALALAASLAAQILNQRRWLQQEATSLSSKHARSRVKSVWQEFKRLEDDAGNVWFEGDADWLTSMTKASDSARIIIDSSSLSN
ncbi:hypothetical protein F4679DRAFT_599833 [Xylaria curta]|nr:hypothetical protein F4679DRAFT_599833 [Xylaria curta]